MARWPSSPRSAPVRDGLHAARAVLHRPGALRRGARTCSIARMWVGVGRLEEMPARGDYVTREIAGDSLVIVRANRRRRVRAFYNVCRHRGTQLCADDGRDVRRLDSVSVPRVDLRLRRPAHRRAAHGRIAGIPTRGLPARRGRARTSGTASCSCRCRRHGPSLRDATRRRCRTSSRPWRMGDLVRAHRIVYDVHANWKLIVQNYNECLHCPTLHPALNKLSHYLSGENEPLQPHVHGRPDGSQRRRRDDVDGRARAGAIRCRVCRADERRRVYYYSVFPNFLIAPHPDYVLTHTLWPAGAEPHAHRLRVARAPGGSARKPGFDLSDATQLLGHDEPAGLARLRAGAGRHQLARLPSPARTRIAKICCYAFDRFIVETLEEE